MEDTARRRDAGRTRRRLLDAARERFAADGFSSTTVRQVADDAGVDVALIKRYFGSKEGLFEACLAAAVDDLREQPAPEGADDVATRIAHRLLGPFCCAVYSRSAKSAHIPKQGKVVSIHFIHRLPSEKQTTAQV